ncbi:family 2 glycosyl transferase [Leptolyngbya sp. KIOST-1]|uniref:family 2 glycosyl transferase n=1 Tax=Leptolyngbya sp. KIOST-1 TaxID=1229172 RepID=UPI000AB38AF3|nr:family 2 glycosyl transferase [Leptolyngbya sp. KIOST-1]
MVWELCIRYANGKETVLDVFQSLEIAQNRVDKLYAEGYPMHFAYFVRPGCVT